MPIKLDIDFNEDYITTSFDECMEALSNLSDRLTALADYSSLPKIRENNELMEIRRFLMNITWQLLAQKQHRKIY